MAQVGWDIRTELERHPEVRVVTRPLPPATGGGLYVRRWDGRAVIGIDPSAVLALRTEVLTHELMHHRLGHRCDRRREEAWVRRETAECLVPVVALAAFCDQQADLGEGVGPEEVMHEFDCTRRVAEDALTNLMRHERGR